MAVLRRFGGTRGVARNAIGLALALVFLAGCGGAPYVDARREAGQKEPVGTSTPNMVSICYSSRGAGPADLQKLADSECALTGRVALLAHEERWTCTLLTPRRIFYSCVAKP